DFLVGSLIFLIGVDLGFDEKTIGNVKKAGLLIFLFPLFNIIGTTIGAIVSSIFCRMDIWDALALGEGYAWFSIAPSLLLKYGLIEPAAISFLHNVLREIFSIIFIPIVAKKVGYIECICLSGAASMDDCLPIIEKSTTPAVAIYGFVSGVVLTAAVPIITPFFASIAMR
ncbi:MAG: lysine exporter LysO family protein, partial [Lachnospiraceae bacterium]|nr:lysine exporter LysO family protein [Lachnospiraceae bacterium]